MKRKRVGRVSKAAPVQVYLAGPDRDRLERLAKRLELSKSDVIRQGIEALERQVEDPALHPLLRIIGIAGEESGPDPGYDVAREHDRFLAESEMASWGRAREKGPRVKQRKRRDT